MNFSPENYNLILQDAVYALSVGFLAGFFHQLLRAFLPKNKQSIFFKDLLSSLIFTILLFSYVISFANFQVMRWYHVVFALLGFACFSPCFSMLAGLMGQLMAATFKILGLFGLKKIKKHVKINLPKKQPKRKKVTQTSSQNTLQNQSVMLYNQ